MSTVGNFNDLKNRITALETEFKKFLKPSDIIFNIQGLDEGFIEELLNKEESDGRRVAVEILINKIKENEDLLSKFVWVLSECGYQRFSDPINSIFQSREETFRQNYFEFLISLLKGDLLEMLEPLELSGILYQKGCIEISDKEVVHQVQNTQGSLAACQELFFRTRRRKENWAILFVEAIKESDQEFVKQKMDPLAATYESETSGITTYTRPRKYKQAV